MIAQLEQGVWHVRDRRPCDFCDAVFCSEECLRKLKLVGRPGRRISFINLFIYG